jgi:hypothetical protein
MKDVSGEEPYSTLFLQYQNGTSTAFHSSGSIPAIIVGFVFADFIHAHQVSSKSGDFRFSALALLT